MMWRGQNKASATCYMKFAADLNSSVTKQGQSYIHFYCRIAVHLHLHRNEPITTWCEPACVLYLPTVPVHSPRTRRGRLSPLYVPLTCPLVCADLNLLMARVFLFFNEAKDRAIPKLTQGLT